jgi:hypothetical protein
VRDVRIPKGTRLAGFKDPRVSPFRTTFFTVVGTPIEILAWSEKGREHPVAGGGWQYKIPHPERYVRYTTAFPQAPRPPADR